MAAYQKTPSWSCHFNFS